MSELHSQDKSLFPESFVSIVYSMRTRVYEWAV